TTLFTTLSIMSKPMIKFVKEANCPRVIKINNTENARKSTVKYAEMYRNISKDEPASLSRDDRHREAFPTVFSLDAGQDRENIAKTSAMSHESSPRVPYLDAYEGRGIIDIREELGADKSTEKGSNDTKEMVNMLSSLKAVNILSSGGTKFSTASVSPADVFPTAGVPTVSGS
nr:hypothetical protein [Tanacetum cinerariifolium]